MSKGKSGSGKKVKDFSSFCEGDVEPTLNKKIRVLIDSTATYIVYLDEDLYVEWSTLGKTPKKFADIANAIGHLETLALGRLRPDQCLPFERLLGEAMARVIGDDDITESRAILSHAATYLNARSVENARAWHIGSAAMATAVAALFLAIAVVFRPWLNAFFGDATVIVATASLLGPFGALLSILSRVRNLEVNPLSGAFIHRFEGVCRIGAGLLGALLIALGVQGNLIFGLAHKTSHPFVAMLVVCFVSGASERMVPSFISQIEGGGKAKKKRKKKKNLAHLDSAP